MDALKERGEVLSALLAKGKHYLVLLSFILPLQNMPPNPFLSSPFIISADLDPVLSSFGTYSIDINDRNNLSKFSRSWKGWCRYSIRWTWERSFVPFYSVFHQRSIEVWLLCCFFFNKLFNSNQYIRENKNRRLIAMKPCFIILHAHLWLKYSSIKV